eukprot:scaffold21569_cov107-Isochrysis_galbana.AAC.3
MAGRPPGDHPEMWSAGGWVAAPTWCGMAAAQEGARGRVPEGTREERRRRGPRCPMRRALSLSFECKRHVTNSRGQKRMSEPTTGATGGETVKTTAAPPAHTHTRHDAAVTHDHDHAPAAVLMGRWRPGAGINSGVRCAWLR